MLKLKSVKSFVWDKGNIDKNWIKHKVKNSECEQIFFNKPLLIFPDLAHSLKEKRLYALGKNKRGRKLFVSFTIRNEKIRIISARDQNKKERKEYEKA